MLILSPERFSHAAVPSPLQPQSPAAILKRPWIERMAVGRDRDEAIACGRVVGSSPVNRSSIRSSEHAASPVDMMSNSSRTDPG